MDGQDARLVGQDARIKRLEALEDENALMRARLKHLEGLALKAGWIEPAGESSFTKEDEEIFGELFGE